MSGGRLKRLPLSPHVADIKAREQQLLWRGRLPLGHVSIVGAEPNRGKSQLGYLAADVGEPTIWANLSSGTGRVSSSLIRSKTILSGRATVTSRSAACSSSTSD